MLRELIPGGTPEELKPLRELLFTARMLATECAEHPIADEGSPFHQRLLGGKWDEKQTRLTLEPFDELAMPTQADAQALRAVLEGLATGSRHKPLAAGFKAWHDQAIRDEPSLYWDVVPHRIGKENRIERRFAQLLEQIDTLLSTKSTAASQP